MKITVRSPAAVAYLAQAPGELGLARAYVAGQLDVEGDMYEALARMTKAQSISLTMAEKLRLLQALGGPKLLLHRMPPPPQEVTQTRRWLTGRMHSKTRDAKAISHHYDVSNRFYEWVLGPSMAYTCACYPTRTRPWKRRRRTSSTWSPASWGCTRACGCSTSAAAGAAW